MTFWAELRLSVSMYFKNTGCDVLGATTESSGKAWIHLSHQE